MGGSVSACVDPSLDSEVRLIYVECSRRCVQVASQWFLHLVSRGESTLWHHFWDQTMLKRMFCSCICLRVKLPTKLHKCNVLQHRFRIHPTCTIKSSCSTAKPNAITLFGCVINSPVSLKDQLFLRPVHLQLFIKEPFWKFGLSWMILSFQNNSLVYCFHVSSRLFLWGSDSVLQSSCDATITWTMCTLVTMVFKGLKDDRVLLGLKKEVYCLFTCSPWDL